MLETTPLLMVVGGYNSNATNGLLHDVELISATPNNLVIEQYLKQNI
jgi:N-acetylneuraminic acid mutarotase